MLEASYLPPPFLQREIFLIKILHLSDQATANLWSNQLPIHWGYKGNQFDQQVCSEFQNIEQSQNTLNIIKLLYSLNST